MTVATMDDLTALPEGTIITIADTGGTDTWTRTADGFVADGRNLTPDLFAGYVALNRVTVLDQTLPRVGEWWHYRTSLYHVLSEEVAGFKCLVFSMDSEQITENTVAANRWRTSSLRRATGAEVATVVTLPMMTLLIGRLTEAQTTTEKQAVEVRQLKLRPEPAMVRRDLTELRNRIDSMLSTVGGD